MSALTEEERTKRHTGAIMELWRDKTNESGWTGDTSVKLNMSRI